MYNYVYFFNDDYSTVVDRLLAKEYSCIGCIFLMIFGKVDYWAQDRWRF